MLLALALKELKGMPRAVSFYVLTLTVGLFGFILVEAWVNAFQKSVEEKAKTFLGADLAVTARRELTQSEWNTLNKRLPPNTKRAQMIEAYSMVRFKNTSKLVEVHAIEQSFPFYGNIEVDNSYSKSNWLSFYKNHNSFLSLEAVQSLEIKKHDKFYLGTTEFVFAGTTTEDSTQSWNGFSMAPRIYVSLESFRGTKLIQKGSTFQFSNLFKFPNGTDIEGLNKSLSKDLIDPAIKISTYSNASNQLSRMSRLLTDYLAIVSLVGVFLSGFGSMILFRNLIQTRMKAIGIYRVLGLTGIEVIKLYSWILLILTTLGLFVSLGLVSILLPPLRSVLLSYYPTLPEVKISLATVAISGGAAFGIAFLASIPRIWLLRNQNVSFLFSEYQNKTFIFSIRTIIPYLPLFIFTYFLSCWVAHSWKVGSAFFGCLIFSSIVLIALANKALKYFERIQLLRGNFFYKFGILQMSRERIPFVSIFLALGMGSLLVNLIPQIEAALIGELAHAQLNKVPGLFLFDIQEDQLIKLNEFFSSKKIPIKNTSPLIRARLVKINNDSFEKQELPEGFTTREDEQDSRMRNRGFNLTIRDELAPSETLLKGEWIKNGPYASVEEGFAKRFKLKIHDLLVFEIQGVQVQTEVRSIRKVDWLSFEPNFFVELVPGQIDQAPKTFIVSISKLDIDKKQLLSNELALHFPNISQIDPTAVIHKLLSVVKQMNLILNFMALLTLLSGLVVLFVLISSHIERCRNQINLLKILGSSENKLLFLLSFQIGIISAAASTLGIFLGFLVNWFFSKWIFDTTPVYLLTTPLLWLITVILVSVCIAFLATYRVYREKPLQLFQNAL